ncbi:MAG: hypothetical protein ACM3WP_20310 [Acidobacteriota bacterium]
MRRTLHLAPLLFLLVLSSCSARDFLSRRLASDLISASPDLKAQQSFLLRTGVVTGKDYPSPEYLVLQNHGWILAATVACPAGLVPPPCWNIVLSPSGVDVVRSAIAADQAAKSSISLPIARRELLDITGIAKHDNSADVEFEWKWLPLNEIGEALYSRDLRYRSSVGFRKYDDGWRLIETPMHSAQSMDDALKNAELMP